MHSFTSKDGTRIAYDVQGSGPALILIDGALLRAEHGADAQARAAALLRISRSTIMTGAAAAIPPTRCLTMSTGSTRIWLASIEIAGGSAHLYGTSSGGALAMFAAARGSPVDRLRHLRGAVHRCARRQADARGLPVPSRPAGRRRPARRSHQVLPDPHDRHAGADDAADAAQSGLEGHAAQRAEPAARRRHHAGLRLPLRGRPLGPCADHRDFGRQDLQAVARAGPARMRETIPAPATPRSPARATTPRPPLSPPC